MPWVTVPFQEGALCTNVCRFPKAKSASKRPLSGYLPANGQDLRCCLTEWLQTPGKNRWPNFSLRPIRIGFGFGVFWLLRQAWLLWLLGILTWKNLLLSCCLSYFVAYFIFLGIFEDYIIVEEDSRIKRNSNQEQEDQHQHEQEQKQNSKNSKNNKNKNESKNKNNNESARIRRTRIRRTGQDNKQEEQEQQLQQPQSNNKIVFIIVFIKPTRLYLFVSGFWPHGNISTMTNDVIDSRIWETYALSCPIAKITL